MDQLVKGLQSPRIKLQNFRVSFLVIAICLIFSFRTFYNSSGLIYTTKATIKKIPIQYDYSDVSSGEHAVAGMPGISNHSEHNEIAKTPVEDTKDASVAENPAATKKPQAKSDNKDCRDLSLSASSTTLPPRDENQKATHLANEKEKWRDAVIVSSRPACPSGKSTVIELEIDDATREEYTVPGQFVKFRPNDESINPIFLAMSSAPSTGTTNNSNTTLQFLIKMAPSLTWLPETLVVGNAVKISCVMGSGFPIGSIIEDNNNSNHDQTILMAAAGSGMAPLKACIESGMFSISDQQKQKQTTLYYGEWTEDDLCFTDLHDSWSRNLGITVVPVLSRIKDTQGYIQEVLLQQEQEVSSYFSSAKNESTTTYAILCGMDDMVESCTRVLLHAGVDQERILLNL
jgi:NAD(P)H-flavin reductase